MNTNHWIFVINFVHTQCSIHLLHFPSILGSNLLNSIMNFHCYFPSLPLYYYSLILKIPFRKFKYFRIFQKIVRFPFTIFFSLLEFYLFVAIFSISKNNITYDKATIMSTSTIHGNQRTRTGYQR